MASKSEQYIIGDIPIPWWCKRELMAYQKDDGTIGFEYYGRFVTFELKQGDVLVWDGYRVDVKIMKGREADEDEKGNRVFAAHPKAEHDDPQQGS